MKLRPLLFITVLIFSVINHISSQGVAINESGVSPNANAILDMASSTKGMLIPRLTTAEKLLMSLSGTEEGLMIYEIGVGFQYYDGANWQSICCNTGSSSLVSVSTLPTTSLPQLVHWDSGLQQLTMAEIVNQSTITESVAAEFSFSDFTSWLLQTPWTSSTVGHIGYSAVTNVFPVLTMDAGTGNQYVIGDITLITAGPTWTTGSFVVETSNDNVSWSQIGSYTLQTSSGQHTVSMSALARYVRIRATLNSSIDNRFRLQVGAAGLPSVWDLNIQSQAGLYYVSPNGTSTLIQAD